MKPVVTGLERLCRKPWPLLKNKRLGLLCNAASVNAQFEHARDLIAATYPDQLTAIYAPQHGFGTEKQDNMIESADAIDSRLNIPVYSLYGKTRIPTAPMLAPIDLLIVDLQDVGTRVYTFIYTMAYAMEASAKQGKQVVVLDRPNPIGGIAIEGNCLSADYRSFVGRYEIPMRHGLTIGEMARLIDQEYRIGCRVNVIGMKRWRRWMRFSDTGLPWVAPSPNLPTPQSATVYPGQVIWEGTHVSEGRGTTQPFELFGAPYINTNRLAARIGMIDGIILRPVQFEPTFNKWKGQCCAGFQIHVTHPDRYLPYEASLNMLRAVILEHGDQFAWKPPPYEYEYSRLPIDLILGSRHIRQQIEQGVTIDRIKRQWQPELMRYGQIAKKYWQYN